MGFPFLGGDSHDWCDVERAEDVKAAEVGDRCGRQSAKHRLSSATVTGLVHSEALEVVDLALQLGRAARTRRVSRP